MEKIKADKAAIYPILISMMAIFTQALPFGLAVLYLKKYNYNDNFLNGIDLVKLHNKEIFRQHFYTEPEFLPIKGHPHAYQFISNYEIFNLL